MKLLSLRLDHLFWVIILWILFIGVALYNIPVSAQQRPKPPLADSRWKDARFCGFPIPRDADGSIHRSSSVLRRFKEIWPCPDPVGTTCPGWGLAHVVPLKCGADDWIGNLQWL